MRKAEPLTEKVDVSDAQDQWSRVVDAVSRGEKRVVLEKAGTPVAALISVADLRRLRRYDAERDADFAVLERVGEAFKDVPDDELEREVAKTLSQ